MPRAGSTSISRPALPCSTRATAIRAWSRPCRSEEHTSELQSPCNLVCRLLLEKKKNNVTIRSVNLFIRRLAILFSVRLIFHPLRVGFLCSLRATLWPTHHCSCLPIWFVWYQCG